MGGIDPPPGKRRPAMKCKECQKKITFDHYLGTTRSGSNGGGSSLSLGATADSTWSPLTSFRSAAAEG